MNLLIKGLTIPKNIESFSIKIDVFPDVTHYRTMFGASSVYVGTCKLFIMPEKHGDLIDKQKLLEQVGYGSYSELKVPLTTLMFAPVVIEAEKGDG